MLRLRHLPRPLGTLAATWAAVAACGALALVLAAITWTLASPWHTLLVAGLGGAVVVTIATFRSVANRQHPARQPVRLERESAPPLPRPAPRTAPRPRARPSTRPSTRPSPSTPGRQDSGRRAAGQVAYWGGVRVGTLDEQGRFQPDRERRR